MRLITFLLSFLFSIQLFSQGTWVTLTNSGVTTALQSVSALDNTVCWIGGTSGVVLRTTNGGTTWQNVGGGVLGTNTVYSVWAINDLECLISTSLSSTASNTWVYKTTNGGTTWTEVFTQANGFINCIKMFSNNSGFMTGDPVNGRWSLWRTTNTGNTWDSTGLYLPQVGTEAGWNNSMYIGNGGQQIWFGTNNTKLYYSSNGGTTWSAQATTGTVNTYAVWFKDQINGYAGASGMVKTTNSGTNWTLLTGLPGGTTNISGIFGGGDYVYFSRQSTAIYHTTNNGTTWGTAYTAPSGSIYHLAKAQFVPLAFIGEWAWAVSSNGLIHKGENIPTPVELTSFTALPSGNKVILNWSTATEINNHGFELERQSAESDYITIGFIDGKGTTSSAQSYSFNDNVLPGKYSYRLRQVDFDGTSKMYSPVEVDVVYELAYSLEQNYPNPFNPSTRINFTVVNPGIVKLSVYNLLGQEVKSLVNEFKEAGTYNVGFDASDLSSGAYFYKLETAQFTKAMKMILTK